jgi:catecholate siderophore receptor
MASSAASRGSTVFFTRQSIAPIALLPLFACVLAAAPAALAKPTPAPASPAGRAVHNENHPAGKKKPQNKDGKRTVSGSSSSAVPLGSMQVIGYPDTYRIPDSTAATRTDTPLIDIPQTLQAIPIRLLHDQGALSLEDAVRNAPGVSVELGDGNRDEFFIRGVKTKKDFFIDGVRDDTEYFRDLYNVQEVDVLQGPAAVLFGRGNAGGLINLVTKQPQRAPIRRFTAQAGTLNFLRDTVDFGNPIGDNAAFRVNAVVQHNGGFRDYFYERRYGINPEIRFWLDDNTTLDLSYNHLSERLRDDRGIPSRNGRPVDVSRDTFFGSVKQNHARNRVDAVNARISHDVSDSLTLRDTFRGTRTDKFYQNLFPGSAVAASDTLSLKGYLHGNTRTSYFNHAEMIFDTRTGSVRHKLLLGFDLGYQTGHDYADEAETVENVPLADPTANSVFDIPGRNNDVTAHSEGIYVEDQISWGAHWKALAGVRWDRFSVDAQYHLLPNGNATHNTDTALSPRVGVIYKPAQSDSLYASISRTFTPQGSNLALSLEDPEGANFDPQTAVNYEIGNKLNLFDNRLSMTVALFQLDLDNVLSQDPNNPSRLVQTGEQRNRGFEFTVNGRLTSNWSIWANYAYIDAEIVHATTEAPAGAEVGLVPHNQFSMWTRYDINDHWGIGGGMLGRSRVYTSFSNNVVLPGYVRAGAMAYYQNGNYRLQLNVENLFDTRYYATAGGDNQIMPGAPINALLRFSVTF